MSDENAGGSKFSKEAAEQLACEVMAQYQRRIPLREMGSGRDVLRLPRKGDIEEVEA